MRPSWWKEGQMTWVCNCKCVTQNPDHFSSYCILFLIFLIFLLFWNLLAARKTSSCCILLQLDLPGTIRRKGTHGGALNCGGRGGQWLYRRQWSSHYSRQITLHTPATCSSMLISVQCTEQHTPCCEVLQVDTTMFIAKGSLNESWMWP